MTKPTLLYLPGLDGTGRLLHRQPRLHQEYRVLCESYPQDRPVTYAGLAGAAADRLEQAAGGRPGVVLAESFGGGVALTLALARPDLVGRLVLVNTFAYFPARWLVTLGLWLGRFAPDRPSPPSTRGLRGYFFFSKDIPRGERDAWWERTADVPVRAFAHRLAILARLDLRGRLGEIDTPALVLAAPDDRVVPPRAGRDLAARLPRAHLIEPRVGHAALIHPDVDVARFLATPSYWPAASAADRAAPAARPG